MSINKQKIIVVLGQTATGKSNLGVRLAKKFNGEIISADSRQVYKGLDIGTGKITKKEMDGVPHHMLDIVSLRQLALSGVEGFTAAEYKKRAEKIIQYIERKGKVPVIVGGTGFYIDALLGKIQLPNVPPNKKLREKLKNKTAQELFEILKKIDPKKAHAVDKHNPVRLIRAVEIVRAQKNTDRTQKYAEKRIMPNYDILKIGIKTPGEELKQKISIRLFERIRDGMITEAKKLHAQGLSWKRMEMLGLEYRFLALCLQGKIGKKEMTEQLNTAIWHYAKRQKTWFKRDKDIQWFNRKEFKKIQETVKRFLVH